MALIDNVGKYKMLDTEISNAFQAGLEETQDDMQMLYVDVPSGNKQTAYNFFEHTPGFRELGYDEPKVMRNLSRNEYVITNKHFEDTIRINEDDFEDDNFGMYPMQAKQIGELAKKIKSERTGALLNGAFSTTTTYDGSAWCSNSHTLGVSTINNLMTEALDANAFEAAYNKLMGFTVQPDIESKPRKLNGRKKLALVVPPELEITARKIVEVKTLSTGGENIYAKLNVEIVVNDYDESSGKYWFLMNIGGAVKPIFWQNRKSPVLRSNVGTPNDIERMLRSGIIYTVDVRGEALPTHPWLIVGSNGTT